MGLKLLNVDGDGWLGSNLTGGSERSDVIEVWVAGLAVRVSLISEVYMTATLVDGEFIVPVRDHPIATKW